MKILHVIPTLSPRFGGPVTTLRALAREQASEGHQVYICSTNENYYAEDKRLNSDVSLEDGKVSIRLHRSYFRPLILSTNLMFWLKREMPKFEIVHIHGLYRFPVTYAAWCARKQGVPYIIQPHGSLDPFLYRQSRYGKAALLIKRIYERVWDFPNLNNATAIHYTAQEEADRASFLKLKAKAVIIPNGIEWEAYENLPPRGSFRGELGLNATIPLVLFLGRVNFKKGLDLLVPAFAKVIKVFPQARLAIVGPDNEGYRFKVKRWCHEQGIEDSTFFVEHLSKEDVKRAYVDADVFVLSSYTENFGNTVVEAMACSCPVVISDQVNIWREIKDAGAGIIVQLNPSHIADAIIDILQNKENATTMGARGRSAARNNYAWPRISQNLSRVYEELVKETNARRYTGN